MSMDERDFTDARLTNKAEETKRRQLCEHAVVHFPAPPHSEDAKAPRTTPWDGMILFRYNQRPGEPRNPIRSERRPRHVERAKGMQRRELRDSLVCEGPAFGEVHDGDQREVVIRRYRLEQGKVRIRERDGVRAEDVRQAAERLHYDRPHPWVECAKVDVSHPVLPVHQTLQHPARARALRRVVRHGRGASIANLLRVFQQSLETKES
jgi:hypothetical protein